MSIKKIKKISKKEIAPDNIYRNFDHVEVFSIILKPKNMTFTMSIKNIVQKPGDKRYIYLDRYSKTELIDSAWDFLSSCPVSDNSKKYWIYDGWLYEAKHEYEADEARLLILEEIDKERKKFERLRQKFDLGLDQRLINTRRERIPEEVKIEVWRRDEGKCVKCGSQENLECQLPSP